MSSAGSEGPDFPEKEPNPFAEEMEEQPYEADPYASPHSEGYSTKQAGHYDAAIPGRGGVLLILGIAGLAVAIIGLIPLLCCLPINVLALALTVPAWLMSQHDLEGMALGAIDDSDRGRTRAAHLLGIGGTALIVISIAAVVVMIVLRVGSSAIIEFHDSLGF